MVGAGQPTWSSAHTLNRRSVAATAPGSVRARSGGTRRAAPGADAVAPCPSISSTPACPARISHTTRMVDPPGGPACMRPQMTRKCRACLAIACNGQNRCSLLVWPSPDDMSLSARAAVLGERKMVQKQGTTQIAASFRRFDPACMHTRRGCSGGNRATAAAAR